MNESISRRSLLAGAAAIAAAQVVHGQGITADRFQFIVFNKPFQALSADQTAELVAEVGWDGIECPVRAKGQVEPERVEDDLPKLVEALRKRQRHLVIITTDVREVTPLNEKVLRTAARLGIRKYRLAHYKYEKNRPLTAQLKEIAARYRDLAALNKELGIQAGYQNHSGVDYVGSAIWDIHSVLSEFDPAQISAHFDIGHATVEGGMSWATQARLIQPLLGAVYVKDFAWTRTAGGWRARWCPVGEGMISRSFFDNLKNSDYSGPISQHFEYFEAGASRESMIAACRKDLQTVRSWLA